MGMKKTIGLTYDKNMLVQVFAQWPCGTEQHLSDFKLETVEDIAANDIA